MKYGWAFLLGLVLFTTGCEKENTVACLKGRVVRVTCASTVIQVLNSESIGQDGWKDSFNNANETYDNVFTLTNTCKISKPLMKGDEFWFSIGPAGDFDCVICMMVDYAPNVSYSITGISDVPCSNE